MPVSVEIKPPENKTYAVIKTDGEISHGEYLFLNKYTYYRWFDDGDEAIDNDITHWLKPQSLYCFTKEELKILLEETYAEGYEYDGRHKLYMLSGMQKTPNFKSMTQHIKQLLP